MSDPLFYKLVRPLLYLFVKIKFNPEIIYKEKIPKKGRIILAGTHTNNYDSLLLGATTKRCVRFVAKNELMKGPKKLIFKGLGIIPVNRKIHDKSVIPTCCKYLENESLIGIFPEGTINRTKDKIMPFKKGAVVMAIKTKTPIIPFAINGIYKRGKLKIIIGKKYIPKSDDVIKEIELLEKKVIKLIDEIGEK